MPRPRFFLFLLFIILEPRGGRARAAQSQPASAPSRPAASDPRAERLVERGLEAAGGRERLARVATLVRLGSVRADSYEGFYGEWMEAPARKRVEIAYPLAAWTTVVDRDVVTRRVGDGVRRLFGAERAEWIYYTSPWPELDGREKQWVYEAAGEIVIDGNVTLGARIFRNDGSVATNYYDRATGRLARRDEASGGGSIGVVTYYYDYAETGGVQIARRVRRELGARASDFTFENVTINETLDRNLWSAAWRRPDEALALSTIPQTLHLEPLDPALRVDQLTFRLAAPALRVEGASASLKLTYRGESVEARELSQAYLLGNRESFSGATAVVFHLEVSNLIGVDEIAVEVREGGGQGRSALLRKRIDRYQTKTQLCFPLRMPAMVLGGHGPLDHHATERSQAFAFDLAACDFDARVRVPGAAGDRNDDFAGYGSEVIAPGDGRIVYVRNDIPENPRPGELGDVARFMSDPEAVCGNGVIIDHKNGEFSFLGHLQPGSIVIHIGEEVRQGDSIGRLGNSGYSSAPHLHYHLMDGPKLFYFDGLPARFAGVVDFHTDRRMPFLRVGAVAAPVGPGAASRPASAPASAPAVEPAESSPRAGEK